MSEITLSPEIQRFAEQMELKLREDEHTGRWEGQNPFYLMERMTEELDKLNGALVYGPDKYDRQSVISEAIDIANFAMMIAANAENDSFQFP